jgi:transcriptional antiterminator NusG
MFRWYVINTYSGHENKVKHNLEHRVQTMGQGRKVRQVVVPTEEVSEIKDGKKVSVEKRTMPGYVLVQMEMTDDAWGLVKNTPGVTGFVGSRNKPLPLSPAEVDNLLHKEVPAAAGAPAGQPAATGSGAPVSGGPGAQERPKQRAQYEIGETVKVISGPLSDFSGEIAEINDDAAKLKVLVSIFGRETPVEVGYDQVKKV